MAAHQAPPSLGLSRQEHWSGLPFPSPMPESEKWRVSRSVMSDSLRPHGLQPTRLLHPWDFPGKSTGVGCHCLLQQRVLQSSYSCELAAVLTIFLNEIFHIKFWISSFSWQNPTHILTRWQSNITDSQLPNLNRAVLSNVHSPYQAILQTYHPVFCGQLGLRFL